MRNQEKKWNTKKQKFLQEKQNRQNFSQIKGKTQVKADETGDITTDTKDVCDHKLWATI